MGCVMKDKINLICSVLALFCFVAMFVPVIAPRYPAGEYYAQPGNSDYFYTGDYYLAKDYWAITDHVFNAQSIAWRIALSLDQALLLFWALTSVRGEAGRVGLAIAVANLALLSVVLIRMLGAMWGCRWGVLATMAVVMVMSVVMAANVDGVRKKT